MKKIGRGASYRKALSINLINNLQKHKKIQTTRARGKYLMQEISKMPDITAVMKTVENRRGDNSPMVSVEIIEKDGSKKLDGGDKKSNVEKQKVDKKQS